MVFVMRKLDRVPQGLGDKLRALRRGQAVTLDMMERETHIQRRYLEALEHGGYEVLPEPMYTRNFIRAYTRVLNADADYFIELYEEECGKCDLVGPMRLPRQKVRKGKLFVWSKMLKMASVAGCAVLMFGYLGYQVTSLISAPKIELVNPGEESVSSEAMIMVMGKLSSDAAVFVNGEAVVMNQDHTFSVPVDLAKGINTIKVEAARRYSRKTTINRTVVFNPEVHPQVSLR